MKTEKKKSIRNFILPVLAALLLVGGLLHYYKGYHTAVDNIYAEHITHLGDIVKMTDRNIDVFSKRCRAELVFAAGKMQPGLAGYLENGDAEQMLLTMDNAFLLQDEVTEVIVLLDEEKILLCTRCGDACTYTFPNGRSTESPCICLDDEGNMFIALVVKAGVPGYYYAALINPDLFYKKVIGTGTDDYYWLALYDSENAVLLQSDRNQPGLTVILKEEALLRNDGVTIMTRSEEEQKILTGTYYFNDPFFNQRTEYLISALPRELTDNGHFTIGVAQESQHLTERIGKTFHMTNMGTALILAGFSMMAVLIAKKLMENRRDREKVMQLEQELRTLEELSHHQRLEMMGMMTGSMAHELRNILTPIMGYSMMAMNKVPEDSEELMNDLAEIYDSSLKAKNLVSRLLALSYKNNERKLTVFPADEAVNDVVELAKPLIPENTELEMRLNCRDVKLHADRSQISQVFMNIVVNALQAMEQGGRLTITTCAAENTAVFRFSDTGKGIPAEVLPMIFEPFFSTKGVEKGTGLGLAIVQHIITEHGGTVEAESEEGKGTTITVRLPVEK